MMTVRFSASAANFSASRNWKRQKGVPAPPGTPFVFLSMFSRRARSGFLARRMRAKHAVEDSIHIAKLPLQIKRVSEGFRIENLGDTFVFRNAVAETSV